ncbi:MAG: DNA polymerase III subunit delta' [Hormoscilla sp. GUM202]|nr:DNA polymerase III subunit delta' [Hormoscilla sp. GUM202]
MFFERVIGQEQAVKYLREAIARQRLAPAYLFAGPDGVGKSIAVKCFIEAMFCDRAPSSEHTKIQKLVRDGNHPDVLWVEPTYQHQGQLLSAREAAAAGLKRKAPPQIRIEQVREIASFISRSPLKAPRHVVVIEQAPTMAEAAANSLLKTLEEPGSATIILLASSDLLPTIRSRCARIPFYRLPKAQMSQILRQLGYEEILQQDQIMAMAQGSPGEAIACFAQLQAIPAELLSRLRHLPVSRGEVSPGSAIRTTQETPRATRTTHETPPNTLRDALELAKEINQNLDTEAQLWLVDYLQHSYWQQDCRSDVLQQLETARKYLLSYAQPRLVWEVTLLAMC